LTLSTSRSSRAPYIGLGLGLLAVSTASVFIRYALAAGAPALVIAAWRLGLASLALLPVVVLRHRPELRALTGRQLGLALVSGVFLALHFGTWITSLAHTTVANAAVLVSSSPLFVALIAALFLREKLTRALIVGLALTLAGGGIVGVGDACLGSVCPPVSEFLRGEAFFGDMLALAGAAAMAVYFTVGKALRASLSLVMYIFLTYSTAALVLMGATLVAHQLLTGYAGPAYLWFGLLAFVPQLIGHSSFNWALKYLSATYVSITILGEPLGSALLALWLLGEQPGLFKLMGGALILIGIFIASRPSTAPLRGAAQDAKCESES